MSQSNLFCDLNFLFCWCRYTQEVGRLWCSLADYYIRLGLFEKARDIYEEAIDTATTVCLSIFCLLSCRVFLSHSLLLS
jgi:pentatricopeptide repeat protein